MNRPARFSNSQSRCEFHVARASAAQSWRSRRCVVIATIALTAASAACSSAVDPPAADHAITSPKRVGFTPSGCSQAVDDAIRSASARYNLPRWFYYAIVDRESSFNPNAVNSSDGGQGLTQLTGLDYVGTRYPENLASPDNSNSNWYYDMGLPPNELGPWINMNDVSPMSDPQDPQQNLDRFSSGYAAPAFYMCQRRYGFTDPAETLRAVAYHWNKGLPYTAADNYDPNNTDYLALYDQYVSEFRPQVEAEDGVWNGSPAVPPYSSGSGSGSTGGSFVSTATVSPSCATSGTVNIQASVTNQGAAATGLNIDIAVFDSADNAVGQLVDSSQSLASGQTGKYAYAWPVPSTSGAYSVQIGVFDSNWNQLAWNSNAATVNVAGDTAEYGFECGAQQGWAATTGAGVTSLAPSSARAFAGSSSLAVNFGGTAHGLTDVSVQPAKSPPAGATVTFHVWLPSTTAIDSVQPYVEQGAGGNWTWTGNWQSASALTAGAWNTITVTVPSNAVLPLYQVGVEFSTTAAWTGTAYIDSIAW